MQDDYILQYDGDKKTAQKLGAFYTPPELGRRMVDKFSQSLVGKTCLDNCCYDADTEFFSQFGWKKISEYSIND